MQLFRDLSHVCLTKPSVLAIGTFDGLHRGHYHVINIVKLEAQKRQAQTVIMTFHPRPKAVFAPDLFSQDYLSTPEERIALLETLGLDVLILLPFTLELSQTTAPDFVKILVDRLKIVQLCVGHDFVLGKNREGNVEKLTALGREFDYTIQEISPYVLENQVVSSTVIRQQLTIGDVRHAAYLLGRYPSLTSTIEQGARRGRTIGFPTANFSVPPERLLPANGVYATFVRRLGQNQPLPAVTNVGIRPSFGGEERTVEAHIFDFDEDIYGQLLTLEFVERLRPEKKFDGINALVAQIRQDAEQARLLLAAEIVSTLG